MNKHATDWEAALAFAEDYWFQLPALIRAKYTGQVVALLQNHILDADIELNALRQRVAIEYPNQPVLYMNADAEQTPPLFVRSPRFRS